MVIGIRSLALALMLAGGLAVPASADVVYSFDQTSISSGYSGSIPTVVSLVITVTDQAAANGSQFGQIVGSGYGTAGNLLPDPPLALGGTGILSIEGTGLWFASDGAPPDYFDPYWMISLSGKASSIRGDIFYYGEYDDVTWAIEPEVTVGTWATDDALGTAAYCHEDPGCTFSGEMRVSEPASLGPLASGLIGLLLVACRRLHRGNWPFRRRRLPAGSGPASRPSIRRRITLSPRRGSPMSQDARPWYEGG